MNQGPIIFLGILLTFASAWLGLVFAPYAQLGGLEPVEKKGAPTYPVAPAGLVAQGREVYKANGCIYCHSQQVRPKNFGTDIARGWGSRRTVARDYLYERPPFLGSMRTGPDLSNIGARWRGAMWNHLHLYDPRITSPGSIMPTFRYLFETRKQVPGQPARLALELPPAWAAQVPKGQEVVPGPEARALVAYLESLKRQAKLDEATER